MTLEEFGESNRQYTTERPQYQLALDLLQEVKEGQKALDVGSGLGEFSDILVDQGYSVSGLEGVERFVAEQQKRGLNTQHINLELGDFPFSSNEFDLIVSIEVIEHLWNTHHYLSEIHRCLKPNGHFIISTVNYNYWRYRLIHLQGKMEEYTYQSRHKKFYTYPSLIDEVKPLFNIEKTSFYNGKKLISNSFFPNLLSLQFAFLCSPVNKF